MNDGRSILGLSKQSNLMQREATPLSEAARSGHLEVVRLLVEMGAEVDRGDEVILRGCGVKGGKVMYVYLSTLRRNAPQCKVSTITLTDYASSTRAC